MSDEALPTMRSSSAPMPGLFCARKNENDIDLTRMIIDLDAICTDVMLTSLSFNHEGEQTVRKAIEEL